MAKILPKIIGLFFLVKNLPNAIKNRPNGEVSPNLVTLVIMIKNRLKNAQFLGSLIRSKIRHGLSKIAQSAKIRPIWSP
jgi:hypothetical protein